MQARRLPAARGIYWLIEGFRLFRRNPPFITAATLTYLMLVQGVAVLLPGIGPVLLPLLLPALTLVVANACRLVDEGQRPGKDALLRGLAGKDGNGRAMLRLGGLQLAGAVLLVVISTALGDGFDPFVDTADPPVGQVAGMSSPPADGAETAATDLPERAAKTAAQEAAMLTALLHLMLLAAPLIIAFWFAPFLTGWDRVSPGKSLFFSTVATWRNWRAFGTFSFAAVAIAGIVPGFFLIIISQVAGVALSSALVVLRMLLIFLVAPVLTASIYISYRDIFHAAVDDNA